MTLLDMLTAPEVRPFSVACGLLVALLLLELAASLGGFSLLGGDADAPDLDAPELDVADLDPSALDMADLDGAEAGASLGDQSSIIGGALSWLGVGRAPFMVWLAAFLAGFSLSGYALQLLAVKLLGGLASPWPAALVATPLALIVAAKSAGAIARLLPKVQTSAVSRARLAGRVGVIVGGVARKGRPAEVKVTDRHGNAHYIRVEPFEEKDEIAEGEEVVVLRPRRGDARDGAVQIYRAFRLGDMDEMRRALGAAPTTPAKD